MARRTIKQIATAAGPRTVRTPDVTTTNYSVQDLIAWEKYCRENAAAVNPKSAIRTIRLVKRRKRRGCCNH